MTQAETLESLGSDYPPGRDNYYLNSKRVQGAGDETNKNVFTYNTHVQYHVVVYALLCAPL